MFRRARPIHAGSIRRPPVHHAAAWPPVRWPTLRRATSSSPVFGMPGFSAESPKQWRSSSVLLSFSIILLVRVPARVVDELLQSFAGQFDVAIRNSCPLLCQPVHEHDDCAAMKAIENAVVGV